MRPGKTVQTNISLPRETRKAIEKEAEKRNRSLSNLINHILKQWLEKGGKQGEPRT